MSDPSVSMDEVCRKPCRGIMGDSGDYESIVAACKLVKDVQELHRIRGRGEADRRGPQWDRGGRPQGLEPGETARVCRADISGRARALGSVPCGFLAQLCARWLTLAGHSASRSPTWEPGARRRLRCRRGAFHAVVPISCCSEGSRHAPAGPGVGTGSRATACSNEANFQLWRQ